MRYLLFGGLYLFCALSGLHAQQKTLLRAGIPVSLQLNETVASDKVEVGRTLELLVRNEVKVNDLVLIQTGAFAEGIVVDVQKRCRNCCPSLTIKVENVQTIDGQRIYLRGLPFVVKKECGSYEQAVANIGVVMKARVLNNVWIQSNPSNDKGMTHK